MKWERRQRKKQEGGREADRQGGMNRERWGKERKRKMGKEDRREENREKERKSAPTQRVTLKKQISNMNKTTLHRPRSLL